MDRWKITPFKGLGPLVFGSSRKEIRNQLGPDFHLLRKATSPNEIDAYTSLSLHLYYDERERFTSADVAATSPLLLYVDDIQLLERGYSAVISDLTNGGFPVTDLPSGCY